MARERTAIVEAVKGEGKAIDVLYQNVGDFAAPDAEEGEKSLNVASRRRGRSCRAAAAV